jgi:hypothetical protein
MRWVLFLPVFALLTLCSEMNASDEPKGKQGDFLKDDYKALQRPTGVWTRDNLKGKTQIRIEAKEFPKLRLTITELVPGTKDFSTADHPIEVDAMLQERDGKGVLVIEGKDITYGFDKARFLILKGEFLFQKKTAVKLTGTWGETY